MATDLDLNELWPKFRQSVAYVDLQELPEVLVRRSVQFFCDMAGNMWPRLALSDYTSGDIEHVLMGLIEQADDDPAADAREFLQFNYATARSFLLYLAASRRLGISLAKLRPWLSQFETTHKLTPAVILNDYVIDESGIHAPRPKKVRGNVISMKDARRLLQQKKRR